MTKPWFWWRLAWLASWLAPLVREGEPSRLSTASWRSCVLEGLFWLCCCMSIVINGDRCFLVHGHFIGVHGVGTYTWLDLSLCHQEVLGRVESVGQARYGRVLYRHGHLGSNRTCEPLN